MKPIKELRETLTEFGERLHFSNFEGTQKGHLSYDLPHRWLVEDEEPFATYDFYMRVGLHLGRVFQVIMCSGYFVKMRKDDRWDKETFPWLVVLDPLNPMRGLYALGTPYEQWCPALVNPQQQAFTQYQWQQVPYPVTHTVSGSAPTSYQQQLNTYQQQLNTYQHQLTSGTYTTGNTTTSVPSYTYSLATIKGP